MESFWHFASRMFRYRVTIIWAMIFAIFSAGGMGAGLVAIAPVLRNILSPTGQGLPDIARAFNAHLPGLLSFASIPAETIAQLPEGRFSAVVVIVSGLGVLTLFGGAANFLHAYLSLSVVYRTVTNIRRELFHRVVRLPLRVVVQGGVSDIVSRIVNDTNQLSQGFATLLSRTVSQSTKGLAGLIAAVVIDWRLVVSALPVSAVLYIVIRKLGKKVRRASRGALRSQAGLYGRTTEVLQGLRVVKVYTSERYEVGRFHKINKQFMREMMRVRIARALASPLVEVLSIVALGILSLVAAKAIIDNDLDPANFIAALMALGVAGASLKPITGLINEIQASSAAAGRIAELLALEPETGHKLKLPKLPRHTKSIDFEHITFTYPGAREPALRNVSLKIKHGECVAIVGPNGCGKTTLLSLVPRLFDPDRNETDGQEEHRDSDHAHAGSGRVMIDGHDIRDYAIRSVRRQIGVVTQETIVFHGTIASNIAYGAENATEERIEDAARKARAHDFIMQLPHGYETIVGEQGLTLSGGQRQRIAIARAILRHPAILILDEATSMVDGESEAKISEAISEFSSTRTCLIVAHRKSTITSADRIIVMNAGRVVDQGTHAQLLERCTIYQQLFDR